MNKHLLTDRRQEGGQCVWNGILQTIPIMGIFKMLSLYCTNSMII
jgi:hypothetical protein